MTKFRVFATAVFLSASVACMVFAAPKLTDAQQEALDKCNTARSSCNQTCNGKQGTALTACQNYCQRTYEDCLERGGIPVSLHSPDSPTPTPRPGPSATSPPLKSNPTATPRKGRGGISGLPKSSPTATPSPPVLLKKTSTPTPTPKKGHR